MLKKDFVLIGRIAIDFNPTDFYNTLENSDNFNKYIGGSTANTAIGLSRLGSKVGVFAMISDDQFGRYVTNILNKENVDTTRLKIHPNYKLGLTFTEIKSENESSILMYRNQASDLEIASSDIDEEYIINSKTLLVTGTSLSKSPSREAALKAVKIARKNEIKIIFDIDFRNYTWQNEEETNIYYQLVAEQSNIIIGSVQEIELCSKWTIENKSFETKEKRIDALAKHWLKSAEIVIAKDGKNGSILYTKDRKFLVRIVKIKMLKGYGGGDAYASYFLHYFTKENNIKKALKYATAAASCMVNSHSSFDLPNVETLEKFILENEKEPETLVIEKEWNAFTK
ncbi:5-dehydro-2-deoxygluconokinase [Mycoplasma testudineum]|uniref:5-dehydro-2-deoxygluconokinase n=1 Tax=Mycoplasma testudineum TaxID=244584 RepID=A0A4R6IBN9_9MOLU|nr:5-dehydro-2-deoxygluconokinase [Mycoplasma testudineum]TDO18957.1 5-dehydro-2-deoxygluconokinase [Mycoplasma testudineum]